MPYIFYITLVKFVSLLHIPNVEAPVEEEYYEVRTASSNIRLVGGSSQYSGRVEIQFNQKWGTICNHGTGAWAITNLTGYPNATSDIWLDHVMCTGSEKSIFDCDYRIPMDSTYCNHSIDVGVICSSTAAINISLIGGLDQYTGRLEIELDNRRGTVCGDLFSDRNAAVLALGLLQISQATQLRQTRYGLTTLSARDLSRASLIVLIAYHGAHMTVIITRIAGARAFTNLAGYPRAPDMIWLDDVVCTGSEQSIAECTHRIPWGSNDCNHNNDVGVVCSPTADINIRLVGGSSQNSGRVEILLNEQWGYPTAPAQIWLDELWCTGCEQSIADCTHRMPWGSHKCNHNEDVGVVCSSTAANDIRLVGGSSQYSGRVEILYNGTWGTLCDNGFSDRNAVVAGFAQAIKNLANYPTAPAQIWLDDVVCTGCEHNIADCNHRHWGSNNCNHDDDVGVSLINGSSPYSGIVVGHLRTFCDLGFSKEAANVTCTSLGFGEYSRHYHMQVLGNGDGDTPMLKKSITCIGTEKDLEFCDRSEAELEDCQPDNAVGIECKGSNFGQENLLQNRTEYVSLDCNGTEEDIAQCMWTRGNNDGEYGTLGLFCSVNNDWWTVCYTGFTEYAADLICQTLGHGKNKWFTKYVDSNRYYSYSTIGSLICDKNDKLLRDCKVIPMAFYSYGPGECDGNNINIKCLEDRRLPILNVLALTAMCPLVMIIVIAVDNVNNKNINKWPIQQGRSYFTRRNRRQ
ncbi:C163A-like protein [Mya arenaria]|uniref:C163A-like protein n=1 Tax=Mya arenaria TaxID=6604 RepID=A0ABY7G7H6_MYAAR|nr:C163A-like protein [Mya arenaria]